MTLCVQSLINLEEEFSKNGHLKRDDMKRLRKWIKSELQIENVSDIHLFLFLHSCYYNYDKAKDTTISYYKNRKDWPEAFRNRKPRRLHLNVSVTWMLQHPTREGYRIFYSKLIDFDASKFDTNEQLKLGFAVIDFWLKRIGNANGIIAILDAHGVSWRHLPKFGATTAKKFITYVQDSLPARLKSVHFVNISAVVDKFVLLAKMFMKNEIHGMIRCHSDMNSLYEFVPKKCLPRDYGGRDLTIKELHKTMMQTLIENSNEIEDT